MPRCLPSVLASVSAGFLIGSPIASADAAGGPSPAACTLVSATELKRVLNHDVRLAPSGRNECVITTSRFYSDIFLDIHLASASTFAPGPVRAASGPNRDVSSSVAAPRNLSTEESRDALVSHRQHQCSEF